MEIQNSTNDDAMIKVEGGPSGTIKNPTITDGPSIKGVPTKLVVWELGPGQTLTLSIEVGRRRVKVTSEAVKGLQLTEGDKGYAIQVLKNGGRRRRA